MRSIFTLCLFLGLTAAFGQDETPRPLLMDQEYLHLEVKFDTISQKVEGKAQLVIRGLHPSVDSLWLDGINMDIKKIKAQNLKFKKKVYPNGIALFLKKPLLKDQRDTLEIAYSCIPRKGIYFTGWNTGKPKARRQIWTQGQGIDHRHWIPHVDTQNDKLITAITVHSPAGGYQVISNGKLTSQKDEVWSYRMEKPMPSYLIMIAIGKYAVKEEVSGSGVKLENYYYPDLPQTYGPTYFKNQQVFDYLNGQIPVPYPWGVYRQVPVKDFLHGAMENTTATIFGDFFLNDSILFNDMPYVGVNAHELAHQWFGDYITASCAKHHWLQEGFATYYQWKVIRKFLGETAYLAEKSKALHDISQVAIDDQAPQPIESGKAGSIRFYQKSAYVLEMLHQLVGDKAFKKSLLNYLEGHGFENVETRDLFTEFENVYGESLDWFYKQWISSPGIPLVRVQEEMTDSLVIHFDQQHLSQQPSLVYKLPIRIEWQMKNGESRFQDVVWDTESFSFTIPENLNEVAYWAVDPNGDMLWSLQEEKDSIKWYNQALNGRTAHLRAKATNELAWQGGNEAVLLDILENDPSDFVKGLTFQGLLGESEPVAEAFDLGLKSSIYVQQKMIAETKAIPLSKMEVMTNLLKAPSYGVRNKALMVLYANEKVSAKIFLDELEVPEAFFEKDLAVNRHLIRALEGDGKDALDSIVKLSGADYDFQTRMSAIDLLSQVNYCTPDLVKNIAQAAFYFNRHLRNEARAALENFLKDEDYQPMVEDYFKKNKKKYSQKNWAYISEKYLD